MYLNVRESGSMRDRSIIRIAIVDGSILETILIMDYKILQVDLNMRAVLTTDLMLEFELLNAVVKFLLSHGSNCFYFTHHFVHSQQLVV